MYDVSSDLQTFYKTHICLGPERREQLAYYRELNIRRLKGGLDDLAAETGFLHAYPYDYKNQGGYAMHTLNQDPSGENDYDIDVSLIFNRSDLPENPLKARQRVRDALCKRCTNFTKEPEARTNAVTIWYAEGYHIDFAVYRTYVDEFGIQRIEHASTEWKRRSPMEVNNWFGKQVSTLSPKSNLLLRYKPKVIPGQLRRIVRFLKWFCRSRTAWSLPGGMIVSALVAEQTIYKPDSNRDELALYNTIVALYERLRVSCQVFNPVDTSQELTSKTEVLNQVIRLREKLGTAITKLSVLFDEFSCTREKANSAWGWFFNHEYWAPKESATAADFVQKNSSLRYEVSIRCDLAKRENGSIYQQYLSGSSVLPKGLALKFSVESTNVLEPYTVQWIVKNEGDEAREAKQLQWENSNSGLTLWTSTSFKGTHQMICQIKKQGQVIAQATHIVKIKASGSPKTNAKSIRGFG